MNSPWLTLISITDASASLFDCSSSTFNETHSHSHPPQRTPVNSTYPIAQQSQHPLDLFQFLPKKRTKEAISFHFLSFWSASYAESDGHIFFFFFLDEADCFLVFFLFHSVAQLAIHLEESVQSVVSDAQNDSDVVWRQGKHLSGLDVQSLLALAVREHWDKLKSHHPCLADSHIVLLVSESSLDDVHAEQHVPRRDGEWLQKEPGLTRKEPGSFWRSCQKTKAVHFSKLKKATKCLRSQLGTKDHLKTKLLRIIASLELLSLRVDLVFRF